MRSAALKGTPQQWQKPRHENKPPQRLRRAAGSGGAPQEASSSAIAIGAAVLLIGGLLGVGIWMNREVDYEVNEPAAATTDTHAVAIGDGPVVIDLYIDYLCPACKQFEDTYAADLQRWVDDGLGARSTTTRSPSSTA